MVGPHSAQHNKVILITSSNVGSGKTFISTNLAVLLNGAELQTSRYGSHRYGSTYGYGYGAGYGYGYGSKKK